MMHTENRDSQRILPVHSHFLRKERQIPSGTRERFAQHARCSVLTRDGRRLKHSLINQLVIAEHIESGNIHMPNKPHDASRVFRLSNRVFLTENVSGVKQSVLPAPL